MQLPARNNPNSPLGSSQGFGPGGSIAAGAACSSSALPSLCFGAWLFLAVLFLAGCTPAFVSSRPTAPGVDALVFEENGWTRNPRLDLSATTTHHEGAGSNAGLRSRVDSDETGFLPAVWPARDCPTRERGYIAASNCVVPAPSASPADFASTALGSAAVAGRSQAFGFRHSTIALAPWPDEPVVIINGEVR